MAEEQEFRQRAAGGFIAQAAPGGTAIVCAINHTHVRPVTVDPAMLTEAQRLLEELPLDRVPDPDGLPAGSKPPPNRSNPLLVGREEDLKTLAAKIKDAATGPPTVVVSGIGGVGKTQLAGEFAHRYGRYFAGGVYWLNLSDPASIREEVAACGGTGAMDLRGDFYVLPLEERVGAVMSEWYGDLPRLLVLDDCADGLTLEAARPSAGGCRVLATSRGPITDPTLGVVAFALEPLDREESIELLRRYYDGAEEVELNEIASELGDLPLALDLAGRYLRRYRHVTDAGRYLQELKSQEVLGHRSLQEVADRGVSPTGHDMNVGRTFALSLRRLDSGDPVDHLAVRLLARAARFAPGEPIDRRLLLSTLGPTDEELTGCQLEERENALGRLIELGLVGESESGSVNMHKLVATAARLEIEDDEAQASVEQTVAQEVLAGARSGQPVRLEPMMPHLRHVTEVAGDRDDELAYLVKVATGYALLSIGYPAEAVPYLESAVAYNRTLLQGTDDSEKRERLMWLIMRQRNDVGAALQRNGDIESALATFEPLLEALRNNLPQPHEDVASTLTNIGVLKAKLGLLHEVAPVYQEAFDIREAVLAQKDDEDSEKRQLLRDVAESHGNLGALSMDLGRVREAATRYRQALDIYESLEETEHERYGDTCMALGTARGLQGAFDEARDLLEKALSVHRQALQEENPRIVRNLILLGTLLAKEAGRDGGTTGDRRLEILEAAQERLGEALEHLRQRWGEDHPLTAGVMRITADIAEAKDDHTGALSLRGRAEDIRGPLLQGADADSLSEDMKVFIDHGLYDEAKIFGKRALELRQSENEAEGLQVAEATFALGRLLQLLGNEGEAARHLEETLKIREAVLVRDDPATELVRDCLTYLRGGEN